jgi:phage regulator Rha-like protein
MEKDPTLRAHFTETSYPVAHTSPQPCFEMDQHGFCVLIGSFTGKDALEIKQRVALLHFAGSAASPM